jgi:hypothetical protein
MIRTKTAPGDPSWEPGSVAMFEPEALCNHWILLKSAVPIRIMAGVPTVPQALHETVAVVSDTASAEAP